jgi:hypothetical protein
MTKKKCREAFAVQSGMKVCVVQVQKISTWYTSAVAALGILLPDCRDLLFKPEGLWFNTKICDFPTYLCLEIHGMLPEAIRAKLREQEWIPTVLLTLSFVQKLSFRCTRFITIWGTFFVVSGLSSWFYIRVLLRK